MASDWMIGYCTNVHAGTDLTQIRTNLQDVSVPVRRKLDRGPMGVGLWIPAEAADELTADGASEAFGDWLGERELLPFTINGFPYGNFHQAVVKHRVYEPTWWEDARYEYTLKLIEILNRILPAGEVGSISTLPLGWGMPGPSEQQLEVAASNLRKVGERLQRLEAETGRRICVAIEPEPGCVLDTTSEMLAFFERFIPDPNLRRYLTVCHDICHAEVMYERQADVLKQYATAGVGIGKVQVSNAIAVPWATMDEAERADALEQLREFAEDKFLHQTSVLDSAGSLRLVEDLPQLLEHATPALADRSWRIHFHVPIYLESFGQLNATRESVVQCLNGLRDLDASLFTGHLEAETYAWGVLPAELKADSLVTGIADELRWLYDQTIDGR